MMYLLLLIGFVLLIKGADLFVDGSSSIAGILKVPSVIIGLTIVAMGTSAPEAAVSINAGLAGNSDISLGNIVGSNIFNLLVVIGACAVIFPAKSNEEILKRDLWWNIGVSVLLLITIFDGNLSRLEGIIFLAIFVFYLGLMVKSAMKNRIEETPMDVLPLWKSLLFVVLGLAAVVFGGDMVVDNASMIAKAWGMSDTLVGLTIVAVGTSLPELVTSVVAAKKGETDLAVGNVVGSNIFNILLILGTSSVISPIRLEVSAVYDTLILIVVSILVYITALTKREIRRGEGILCLVIYAAFFAYVLMR